jgi:acyl-[acyl-carrier-protein]-phospholipid O-acyltransferase/long-chain-fatty-acid--[acyl-carrier-protein] ligase
MSSLSLPAGPLFLLGTHVPLERYAPLAAALGERLRVVVRKELDLSAVSAWLRRAAIALEAAPAELARGAAVLRVIEPGLSGPAAPHIPAAVPRVPLHADSVVGLVPGEPLAPDVDCAGVREALELLANRAWEARARDAEPLHRQLLRKARAEREPIALIDGARELSRFRTVVGAVALARALKSDWAGQERVGILLPPGLGAALANIGAAFAGKTSVNLNYTLGPAPLASVVRQAGIRTVLTSQRFLDRVTLVLPEGLRVVLIEQVLERVGKVARATAYLAARFLAPRALERFCGAERDVRADDIATLLFSSGSTGEPKGVPLAHANIDANARGVLAHLELSADDRVLGILPLFHAFGVTILWIAAVEGLSIAFYPDPLDPRGVSKVIEAHRVTVAVATPTFLQLYLRKGEAERFAALRLVIAGAERLHAALAEKLGTEWSCEVVEGYGTTECAPIVCVGRGPLRASGYERPATPRGSVGRALPGVALRLAPPDADEPGDVEPALRRGLLWVRGPNVMRGYLDRPELNAKVLRGGWYCTGDIAELDEDRNLRITDRLARFSKIGGEMVPHGVIEQHLQALLHSEEPQVLVTALPCAKKGERLAVLYTFDPARLDAVREALREAGLPALFQPHRDHYLHVPSLPLLGSGKADLRAARALAEERLGAAH